MAIAAIAAANTGPGHVGILPVQRPVLGRAMQPSGPGDERYAADELPQVRLWAQNDALVGIAGRALTPLLDGDGPLHIRMELAKVLKGAGCIEGLGERCTWGDGA
jgi:hypothetical protein